MILWRPVKKRASLMAFSLASAPPLVKKKVSISPGVDFGELRAEARANFGGHERIGVGERCRLIGDGLDDALVAVSDVDRHELAVEVDEALAFGRVEINSLGAGDGNGIDFRLRGPFVERVLAGEIDDFFASHCRIGESCGHGFLEKFIATDFHRYHG